MELGLANAIPVAIGFLANQFGLGNIGEKISEIVGGLRAMVDAALDWLIVQAVSGVQSMLAALGFGGGDEGGSAAVDPSDHDAFAIAAVEGLENAPLAGDDEVAAARAYAAEQEPILSARLEPGIGLRYVFDEVPSDGKLEFSVIIAPNTTTKKGHLPPDPKFPYDSAPGIGDMQKHGQQEKRRRDGEQIWQTESEHVLPFATGSVLWQALSLFLPHRGSPEDKGQTTVVIYERAARIKTTVDNQVSRAMGAAFAGLPIADRFNALVSAYREGDLNALDRGREVLSLVTAPIRDASTTAVERTDAAVKQEFGETEAGYTMTNGDRRAETDGIPDQSRIAEAADAQFDDVLDLVRSEVLAGDALRARMDRILGRG